MAVYNSMFSSVMMFLGFGAVAALIWYGGREGVAGRLTLALISVFLIYGIAIAASLGGLGSLYAQLRTAIGGDQRVFELLDTNASVQDAPDAAVLPASQGRITFQDVSFGYEAGVPVL